MKTIIKRIISPFLKKAHAAYFSKPRKYTYKDISVMVVPTVFPPFITLSTKLLLQFTETLQLKDSKFLELGCGCGIISIVAAKKGAQVTASDINNVALDALKVNSKKNNVALTILHSDLFDSLAGLTFDIIIINPPYYPKAPQSIAENAWYCGEDFEYFRKLFRQLPPYLGVQNHTFMILSEDCELDNIQTIGIAHKIKFSLVSEKKLAGEQNFIFRLERAND